MIDLLAAGLGMFLLRSAILLVIFWGIYARLRSHPRARVLLCRIVSVALMGLPLVSLVPVPTVANIPSFPIMAEPMIRPSQAMATASPQPQETSGSPSSLFMSSPMPTLRFSTWTVADLLSAIWFLGSCFLLVRWLIALLLVRRMAASCQTPPTWACEAGVMLCADLGLRGIIRLGLIERASSPLLVGPRPKILLPRQLFDTEAHEDIRSALAHELGHVKEHDWFWSQWLHVVTAILWPMPLLWFLRRAHDTACELVCDHVAASLCGGAKPYAGSLARQSLYALSRPRLATVPMVRRSGIRQRIDLLLSGSSLPVLSRRAITAAGLSLVVASAMLAGIHLARADDKAPTIDKTWIMYNYSEPEVQNIISKLYSYFQPISSLSYTGTETWTILNPGPDQVNEITKTTLFISSGDRYVIKAWEDQFKSNDRLVKSNDGANMQYMAFNGSHFQQLNYLSREKDLSLRKGPPFWPTPPFLRPLLRNAYFTMPFDFVGMTMTENPHWPVILTPNLYKHQENWVLKTRSFQNGILSGKRGIIMKVLGKNWADGGDCLISVLLDPSKDYYPVAWEFPASGHPSDIFSYVVTELGAVQAGNVSLPYPKTATISTLIDGKLNWMHTITIAQVSVNDIALDDPRFTIDPKKADFIQVNGQPKTAVSK
jgi:beta-lactamase regulating signal transducer with metallopeptidase domain